MVVWRRGSNRFLPARLHRLSNAHDTRVKAIVTADESTTRTEALMWVPYMAAAKKRTAAAGREHVTRRSRAGSGAATRTPLFPGSRPVDHGRRGHAARQIDDDEPAPVQEQAASSFTKAKAAPRKTQRSPGWPAPPNGS